jgi:hypothetical protein
MRTKTLVAAASVLLGAACSAAGTNRAVPADDVAMKVASESRPDADGTSILKTLTTQTIIASTVDTKNGDQKPYGIAYISTAPYGGGKLKKGDLVVCNYANKAGTLGSGTTEEYLPAKVGSKPARLLQSSSIEGCAGLGTDEIGDIFSTDATAKNVVETTAKGTIFQKITGGPMVQPYGGLYVTLGEEYPPGDGYWNGDATSGTVWRIDLGTGSTKPPVKGVITGFKVNHGKPGDVLGPSSLAYNKNSDTLYVADGANNILYAFSDAYDTLDEPKSVVIGSSGKTFSGPAAKNAKVLYSGGALSAPIAMCMLPNGNLIVADSTDNKLVEIESTGAVLDTKSLGKGAGGAIRGVVAVGTSDSNTVLYYNNTNGNNVQELSK